jgi:hypothetical protein
VKLIQDFRIEVEKQSLGKTQKPEVPDVTVKVPVITVFSDLTGHPELEGNPEPELALQPELPTKPEPKVHPEPEQRRLPDPPARR